MKTNYHHKMMFRAVVQINELDESSRPPTGVQICYAGDEEWKMFVIRETAPGLATITSMAKFDQPDFRKTPEEKKERLRDVFKAYPSEVQNIIDKLPSSSIYESASECIDLLPEWSSGPVVILGDAAHAMTTGLGQGDEWRITLSFPCNCIFLNYRGERIVGGRVCSSELCRESIK